MLRAVGQSLQEMARACDVVARVGGDEFAILQRETEQQGARSTAERMRLGVEQLRARFEGKEISVTATLGIAVSLPEHLREGDEPQDLLESAERALERLKQLGTNRIGN